MKVAEPADIRSGRPVTVSYETVLWAGPLWR